MYAILDIETTGGKYNEEGLTEIAIYRFDGQEIRDKVSTLINPEKPIQPFVQQLTGINEGMLRNAPKFHEVAKRIVEITKDCVLVAHNASFDFRVIHNEFKQLGYDFDRPTICTVELTKTLIPDLESYSLGKLCRKLGIPVSDRHRAEGDALATLKLFKILLQKDEEKAIVKKAVKFDRSRDLSSKYLKILENLPNTAGLFFVFNYRKEIIYINKADNLKKEVNKLFLTSTQKANKIRKEMKSLSFEETGSNLVKEIKFMESVFSNRPKFNPFKKKIVEKSDFTNPNLILIDSGRNQDENSVVLIEKNELIGYGYVELNYQINNIDVLRSLISKKKFNDGTEKIVQEYLKKEKVKKIIRFD
ncbi:exonuclease domain-containing protein [Namhaeicola litoreus]|uniref:Exonuclease domain-containing protein n=1 Tax=Namhaeicola litoreus TaxID=1052145 RepID=A0ABW3Y3L4_9FLAO